MHCRKVKKLMTQDRDSLNEAQNNQMMKHIEHCPKCREKYERLDHFDDALIASKIQKIPQGISEGLWESVRKELTAEPSRIPANQHPKKHRPRPALIWGIPSIATACIIILIIWFRFLPSVQNEQQSDEIGLLNVAIYSAQIDGKDAQVSIFQTNDPEMTFVWLDE